MSLFTEYMENCVRMLKEKKKSKKLKQKLRAQDAEIQQLKSAIIDLKENLEQTRESVYQLIGGLHNQETQHETITRLTSQLYDGINEETLGQGENKYPTTRQGDENAEMIRALGERLDALEEKLKNEVEVSHDTAYSLSVLDERFYALVG
jgi:septal ring factor EnvC (AmiA/AmiB activator)